MSIYIDSVAWIRHIFHHFNSLRVFFGSDINYVDMKSQQNLRRLPLGYSVHYRFPPKIFPVGMCLLYYTLYVLWPWKHALILTHPLCCSLLILAIKNDAKKLNNDGNPDKYSTQLIALSKCFPVNTNMAGFTRFSKFFAFFCHWLNGYR